MPRPLSNLALRYGAAVAAVVLAVVVRWLLDPLLGDRTPLITLLIAVVFAAWYGGTGPGLLSIALGTSAAYFILETHGGAAMRPAEFQGRLTFFIFVGGSSLLLARAAQINRERTEAEVRAREQRIRTILESITDAFFALDRAGRFTYINRKAEEMMRRPREELLGKSLYEEFAAIAGTEFDRNYRRALEENETVSFEAFYPPFQRWFEVRVYPSPDGLAIYFHDTTERRQLLEALELERRRLRAVVENVPVGIVLAEAPAGQIVLVNPQVEGVLHQSVPAPAMVDDRRWLAYHPDGRRVEPDEWPLARALRGEVRPGDEFLHERGDGTRGWIRVSGAPIRSGDGRVIGGVVALFDIDAEKKAEQALREADRKKDVFIAILAHELRNPLAPIRNGLQILKLVSDPQQAEQARAMMERQVQQLVRLVDDLLDISRITRNKLELRRQHIDLAAPLDSAVEAARLQLEAAGLELTVHRPDTPLPVEADQARLAQVFGNLLMNAAKFTERGGRVTLTAERQGDQAVVTVADTGIGIPAERLHEIFEMFAQVSPALERSHGGLGIGLSLVRGLVEMHGGSVTAYSAGPGQGSTFIVRLSLALSAPQSTVSKEEPALPPSADRRGLTATRRILIVDDNRDAAESLGTMLTTHGHQVRTAYDGPAGLELAQAFRPDVALLDIGMPRLNGYEVARRLRAEAWGRAITLIALTGWGQQEDRRRSQEAGFDHHLVKPVDPAVLQQLLA